MARAPTIFISANELSGELHAAHLAEALQELRANLGLVPAIIAGNGSERMREAGIEVVNDTKRMGVLGLAQGLAKLPQSLRLLRATREYILRRRPDMVVLVDSRVFHLRLAAQLRAGGYTGRIVYFIAPVRWESLYNPAAQARSLSNPRFLQLREYCDMALLIYPVSLRTYEQLGIPHEFIGHPECELAYPHLSDEQFEQLVGIAPGAGRIIIGAMAGSRDAEVRWIAPTIFRALALMVEAMAEDATLPKVHVVAPVAHPDLRQGLLRAAKQAGLHELTLISNEYNYDLMARADLMVVKSGTALHECALMDAPAVMCYRVPPYLALVLRKVLRFGMPFYGLPNLLLGREVVPELIQEQCNELRIAEVAGELLFSAERRAEMRAGYAQVRQMLCPGGELTPLQRGAEQLQKLLGGR